MRLLMPCLSPLAALRRLNPFFVCALLAIAVFASSRLNAQAIAPAPADRIIGDVNSGEVVALPNHHPIWADQANDAGLLPSTLPVDHLTLVLLSTAGIGARKIPGRAAGCQFSQLSPLAQPRRDGRALWPIRSRHCRAYRMVAVPRIARQLDLPKPDIHRIRRHRGCRRPRLPYRTPQV